MWYEVYFINMLFWVQFLFVTPWVSVFYQDLKATKALHVKVENRNCREECCMCECMWEHMCGHMIICTDISGMMRMLHLLHFSKDKSFHSVGLRIGILLNTTVT